MISSLPAEFFRGRAGGSSKPLPGPISHPLPLNGSLEGSIDAEGEIDEYQITVTDSGTLTIYSTGSTDVYGYLLDSSGKQLDSSNVFDTSYLVRAGTYYVRVWRDDNSDTGNYAIACWLELE